MLSFKNLVLRFIINETQNKFTDSKKIKSDLIELLIGSEREKFCNLLFFMLGYIFKSSGVILKTDIDLISLYHQKISSINDYWDNRLFFNSGKESFIDGDHKKILTNNGHYEIYIYALSRYIIAQTNHASEKRSKILREIYVEKKIFHNLFLLHLKKLNLEHIFELSRGIKNLELSALYSEKDLNENYRRKINKFHPDKFLTGSDKKFIELKKSFDFLNNHLNSKG